MNDHKRWCILVVDDRRKFALHVWRYFNRSLGIGDAPAEGKKEIWMPESKIIPFLDGMHRFCWIAADGRWREKMEVFLQNLEVGWCLHTVVDVMGRGAGYSPALVSARLREWERSQPRAVEIVFVSAYHISAQLQQDMEVLPKSRITLRQIRQKLYPEKACIDCKSSEASQILITGAGFEIRNSRGGFGMLPTSALMGNMGEPFKLVKSGHEVDENRKDTVHLMARAEGFPWPVGDRWERRNLLIQKAALEGDLDLYWDILLGKELARNLGEVLEMDDYQREEVTDKALHAERRMREAFRRSIQEHDWGHTNQSLAAAQLPWHTWLTTNYTRFADRAISLMAEQPWRIIATAAEAGSSVREENWMLENPETRALRYRYLFKLHGDVGHLHTMAIAGHDKAPFSPLSFPVDDLYQIYASAERFLAYSLRNSGKPVVWHIVGHGMADRRLLNLLRLICEQVKGEHLFLVVGPKSEVPQQRLERVLKRATGESERFTFRVQQSGLLAEEYLARLSLMGLPAGSSVEQLSNWFEAKCSATHPEGEFCAS